MRTRHAVRTVRRLRAQLAGTRRGYDIDVYAPLHGHVATRLVIAHQHRSESGAQLAEARSILKRRRARKRLANKLDKALEHQREINQRQEQEGTES